MRNKSLFEDAVKRGKRRPMIPPAKIFNNKKYSKKTKQQEFERIKKEAGY